MSPNFYTIAVEYLKLPNKLNWMAIKHNINNLAKERNLSIDDMIPDLAKVMNEY